MIHRMQPLPCLHRPGRGPEPLGVQLPHRRIVPWGPLALFAERLLGGPQDALCVFSFAQWAYLPAPIETSRGARHDFHVVKFRCVGRLGGFGGFTLFFYASSEIRYVANSV